MPQPQELPHDFRAILRRIQDPKVPIEEANQLFNEHVLPVLKSLIANCDIHFPREVRQWVKENGVSCIWEKLVRRPRDGRAPAYDPDRQDSSFLAWVKTVLINQARTENRRRREQVMQDEKDYNDAVDDSSFKKHQASKDADEAKHDDLANLKRNLQAALLTLLRSEELSPPNQRRNGVDYFAVLLLCVRMQLSRLIHRILYGNNPGVANGEDVLRYVGECFEQCEQYPALICLDCNGSKPHSGGGNHPCQGWCQRRIVAWTPTVGELLAQVDNLIRNSNVRPRYIWIVQQLSHAIVAARSSNANAPVNVLARASGNCWRQWVRRMRMVYDKLRENNSELTPDQIRILNALLEDDNTDA
jgi:hypothetical protein